MRNTKKITAAIAVATALILLVTGLSVGVFAGSYSEEYFEGNYSVKPDWVTEYIDDFQRWQNYGTGEYPRVVDYGGLLSEDEEADLEQRIEKVQQETGRDLVIYTDSTCYGADPKLCAMDFYDYFGYGLGENNSGSILFICMEERDFCYLATGDVEGYYQNSDLIDTIFYDLKYDLSDGEYYGAVLTYIEDAEEIYTTGTLSHMVTGGGEEKSGPNYFLLVAFVAIVGLIAGFASMGSAVKNMQTVEKATQANTYVKPGSLNITNRRDHFLYMTQTRVYSPRSENKSSGGGSSSFSGSSGGGGSFSGGGGKF